MSSLGSSYFVVTAVIFESEDEALRCSQRLSELRLELRWNTKDEFKFSKMKSKERISFLKAVSEFDFKYLAVVLDKSKLDGAGFKFHKSFYKYPIKLMFAGGRRFFREALVCIDKSGNAEFCEELGKYLKRHVNLRGQNAAIKDVRMDDSCSDNLLQMADVICGAISRSLKTNKGDHRRYRPVIIHKEAMFLVWPKRKRKPK